MSACHLCSSFEDFMKKMKYKGALGALGDAQALRGWLSLHSTFTSGGLETLSY